MPQIVGGEGFFNVYRLPEGGDFETLYFQVHTKVY